MGNTIMKKRYLDTDCVKAAEERIEYLFNQYDKVIVNFSGGKDSTALLYITLRVAKRIGKLPVEAVYIDHEAEGIGTIKLLHDINEMEGVDLKWYAQIGRASCRERV
jgi:predicted phosphoadenosine phosphosulfate sulfurtransferase